MSFVAEKRSLSPREVRDLNEKYKSFCPRKRIEELYNDFEEAEIMLTSSFAATSALLLKLISEVNAAQKVYFIDTGFHFKETLKYKEKLQELFNLNIESLSAVKEEHDFTVKEETWKKNPDFCCTINKLKPLEAIKKKHTVWVSGLMEWQSDHRASLDIFENRGRILKFYPLLDVTKIQRDDYIKKHQLPFHPLVAGGYSSIGCTYCTVAGEDRDGRWNNNPKTECGLHL